MNTGLLRYAVGTVLTVYGIETLDGKAPSDGIYVLEQCLPFTVLKLTTSKSGTVPFNCWNSAYRLRY